MSTRFAVAALVRVLPPEVRQRYRREIEAELFGLDRRARTAYVAGLVRTLPALALELRGHRTALDRHGRPLLCRLRLHHWHRAVTDDGERFLRCDRCGKDDDRIVQKPGEFAFGVGMSGAGGWGGL